MDDANISKSVGVDEPENVVVGMDEPENLVVGMDVPENVVDEESTENFEKLVDLNRRLSLKVKKHKNKRLLQDGPFKYDQKEEFNKFALLIEENSHAETQLYE